MKFETVAVDGDFESDADEVDIVAACQIAVVELQQYLAVDTESLDTAVVVVVVVVLDRILCCHYIYSPASRL